MPFQRKIKLAIFNASIEVKVVYETQKCYDHSDVLEAKVVYETQKLLQS